MGTDSSLCEFPAQEQFSPLDRPICVERIPKPDTAPATGVTKEARKAFDATCRHYLKMSGEEFLKRYDRGDFADADRRTVQVRRAISMLRFAR